MTRAVPPDDTILLPAWLRTHTTVASICTPRLVQDDITM
jgi:hypothetical protein